MQKLYDIRWLTNNRRTLFRFADLPAVECFDDFVSDFASFRLHNRHMARI